MLLVAIHACTLVALGLDRGVGGQSSSLPTPCDVNHTENPIKAFDEAGNDFHCLACCSLVTAVIAGFSAACFISPHLSMSTRLLFLSPSSLHVVTLFHDSI